MNRRSESIRNKLLPAGALCLLVMIWWGLSASGLVPGYMLPCPADVFSAFVRDFPVLLSHAAFLAWVVFGVLAVWCRHRHYLISDHVPVDSQASMVTELEPEQLWVPRTWAGPCRISTVPLRLNA